MKILLSVCTKQKGYTLIELIVVFSVIAILSTVGIASFVDYSRQQTRTQAINDFANTLNTAKIKAVSQVKPSVTECNSGTLSGYRVRVVTTNPANQYTIDAICSGTYVDTVTKNLPTGVTFDATTTATNIIFSVLTGVVTGSGNIVFSSTYSTVKKTVNIDSAGVIKIL